MNTTAKLNSQINAIMIAYWGSATPARFAKAERNACNILDRLAAGRKVKAAKIAEPLEWLTEATKDDDRLACQIAG
jgi:hypothetical protein